MNKLNVFILILLVTFGVVSPSHAGENDAQAYEQQYLWKPTGEYHIGFQDFHWITQNCPDFNYNGNNSENFSSDNTAYCHEIVARVYYPSTKKQQPKALYYQPLIQMVQQSFSSQYLIPQEQIDQLSKLKSVSIKKANMVKNKQFPVLLFSPGFGAPVEMYENFITELVSHGYIVVGINTPFINLVELPNGHIVNAASLTGISNKDIEEKFVPLQAQDLLYVYDKLYTLHNKKLFSSMDLNHIGVFGHSIGARVLADVIHTHPERFQAAVTLDIGFDTTLESLKPFSIPFMHQIAANRKGMAGDQTLVFGLGENGYLVELTPSEQDHDYSLHMSFSDQSTLQYLPFFQTVKAYKQEWVSAGFDLRLASHELTEEDFSHFNKTTYVLIKMQDQWKLCIYEHGKKTGEMQVNDISFLNGLESALAKLPTTSPPEQLSESDLEAIKKIMISFHHVLGEMFGTGNGWDITQSINLYLLQFFDTYLKGKENPAFTECTPLSSNASLRCGPGKF